MKLQESGFTTEDELETTTIQSYSYHGFHKAPSGNPKDDFIRFDFEPFKERYPAVHINAPVNKWGDHLTFPDSTSLDISKMSCDIALKVFKRYAADKKDYPTNELTNKEYKKIFESEG